MKITLTSDEFTVTTACKGLSQHIHSKYVVHGLTSTGYAWLDALPDDHGPIMITTRHETLPLDYVTGDPLP